MRRCVRRLRLWGGRVSDGGGRQGGRTNVTVGEGQTVGAGAADDVVDDGTRAGGAVVDLVCAFWLDQLAGGEVGVGIGGMGRGQKV